MHANRTHSAAHSEKHALLSLARMAPPRHVLIAIPRDAGEAAVTLKWAARHVVRKGDKVSLVHCRQADITTPAVAFVPKQGE